MRKEWRLKIWDTYTHLGRMLLLNIYESLLTGFIGRRVLCGYSYRKPITKRWILLVGHNSGCFYGDPCEIKVQKTDLIASYLEIAYDVHVSLRCLMEILFVINLTTFSHHFRESYIILDSSGFKCVLSLCCKFLWNGEEELLPSHISYPT